MKKRFDRTLKQVIPKELKPYYDPQDQVNPVRRFEGALNPSQNIHPVRDTPSLCFTYSSESLTGFIQKILIPALTDGAF